MAAASQGLFTSSLPELYERFLVEPLFRPFAGELLDRAGVTANDTLLDVACGTGIVARLARQKTGGAVVGVDASPAMLAMARSVAPEIDWRQGDAARLPVGGDETFTVVTCHQGLQFFADKAGAIREMRRALAPSGRAAIATWLPADDIPLLRDLQRVAERHLGPIADQRHSFGDADAIRQLLADAGLHVIRVDTVARTIRMKHDIEVFPRLNTMALVAMSAAANAMTDAERAEVSAAISNESVEAAQRYVDGSDLAFELSSNIVVAHA